jgi:hypothetical protein
VDNKELIAEEQVSEWEERNSPDDEWKSFPAHWNACVLKLRERTEEGHSVYAKELAQARQIVRQSVAQGRFQEAVFLSSPLAFASLQRYLALWKGEAPPPDTYTARRGEQLFYAYLNRFCAKNDTTSFFGPVNYGNFNVLLPTAFHQHFRPNEQIGKRQVFMAHWVVKALSHEISTDARLVPYLIPRRNPLARVLGDQCIYLHGVNRALRLPPGSYTLFCHIDGCTSIQGLADGLRLKIDEIVGLLRLLQKARLVETDIPVTPTRVHALQDLQSRVAMLPSTVNRGAQELLEQAENWCIRLQETQWPERIQTWTAAEQWAAEHVPVGVRRGGGTLYADRLAFYEDCQGSLETLEIGGSLYQALTGPILTILRLYTVAAALRWLDQQSIGQRAFEHMKQHEETVRYIDMIGQIEQEIANMPLSEQLATRIRTHLQQKLSAREQRQEIHLTEADIQEICAPFAEMTDAVLRHHRILLPSPDLLVAASSLEEVERGNFRLVLGELHDDCSSLFGGFFAYFHTDPQKLSLVLEQRLRAVPGWERMASIVSERRNKYVTPELPGYTICLGGTSIKDRTQVIPIADVEVRKVENYLTLWANGPLTLYPGDLHSVAHGCFALPSVVPLAWRITEEDEHTPRIVVDGIVVQREEWPLDAQQVRLPQEKGDGFVLMTHARRLQRRYGWPDQLFVKWSASEKPVLIDLAIPWAVRWLMKIADQAERLLISEMYPGPDQLWWTDAHGKHTFELRTAYFYTHPQQAERD